MAERLSRQFDVLVETLTPLHVGDGAGRRTADVDFVVHRGNLYLIDPTRMWSHVGEERLASWDQTEFRLSTLLRPDDYAACSAAAVPISGHLEASGGLLNQIADVEGRPYVPGSSLKGAIRSAVLRATGGPFDLTNLGRSKQWAAQSIERSLFGRNPNHDLFRALRVFDSEPLDPSVLRGVVVAIYSLRGTRLTPKGPTYRLNVVAFPTGITLRFSLSLDEYVLGWPELAGGQGRAAWLQQLAQSCRAGVRDLLDSESRFFDGVEQPMVAGFYQRLAREEAALAPDSFFLPVGWGTGWLAKTIGPGLQGKDGFENVRSTFRLGYLDLPFPKSRRLVEAAPDRPETPVGWVKVTLSERIS